MNRPGQPPQRPPSLGPSPGLGGPFRGAPYPSYGLPPRNVNILQPTGAGGYVPSIQQSSNQRASQAPGLAPQAAPTPGGFLPRSQSGFAFSAGGISPGQHQPSTPGGLQPQTNGTPGLGSMPLHLSPSSNLSGNGAQSVSSASEVGLDPNDFPALGSAPATNSNANNNGNNIHTSGANGGNPSGSSQVATSYASQAGTGGSGVVGGGASATGGTTGSSSQPREFTPDDFPALGNHPQDHSHPPGLNGFEHRPNVNVNVLGSLGGANTTPGMLHLGGAQQQGRSVHPGFGQGLSEAEKAQQRNAYPMKLSQPTHAAWSSPNPTQSQPNSNPFGNPPPSATTTAAQNGTHSTNLQQQPQSQQQQLSAPPGVPPLASYTRLQSQGQAQVQGHANPGTIANAYASNGDTNANPNPNPTPNLSSNAPQHQHPQTPAQQVLMSAADRWGLLGLLAMIKGVPREVDGGLSSVGTDLGTMGLDMGYQGSLYPTFITPWADQSAAHTVEPDFHLPPCYTVQPPPPGPNKAAAFSDETLFFMFYSSPRDALQEVAAQELWNRNWRWHKELRIWITKETGTIPSQKVSGGEQGSYTIWDPENWTKERKEMAVLYVDLEEKSVPAFVPGPGLVLAQAGQQGQAQGQQVQQGQRGFQMNIGGL